MKQKILLVIGILLLTIMTATACNNDKDKDSEKTSAKNAELIDVRIGWQVPWSIQGQLVQVLKHTDILKENGLSAEFVGRTFGPELNEAALAGELDVVLTADQPAATLFSKDKGWIGIGRMMYNRTATYVPIDSPIKDVKGLKGKTIGVPVGAAAERVTVEALKKADLDPKKDVTLVNLAMPEQAPLINSGKGNEKWGNFDALSGFDPAPAVFEDQGLVKIVDEGKVVAMILLNENFLNENKDVAVKLLQSFVDAYDYYRQNVSEANDWFVEESKLTNTNANVFKIAAKFEPNLKVKDKSDISLSFSDDDFAIMQKGADFIEANLGKKVDMTKYVSNKYVDELNN